MNPLVYPSPNRAVLPAFPVSLKMSQQISSGSRVIAESARLVRRIRSKSVDP
ncbi:MAG: hypothetical protein NT005_02560 [Spirochaetes bacterium]|nr:hypothetical protein [Spirochaetota bacterium]